MPDSVEQQALRQKIEEKYQFQNPVRNYFQFHWRGLLTILIPLVFCPMIIYHPFKWMFTLYITIIMAFYWILELMPLYVTGMIPMFVFPVSDILDSETVCQIYFKSVTVLFIGSLMVASAIEHSNLHKRIALLVVKVVGFSAGRIHFSVMFVTFLLSGWISNAAACALMCPIINALLEEMESQGLSSRFDETKELRYGKKQPSKIAVCLYASVCFSSSMGGCISLIGSATNLAFKGLYDDYYPNAEDQITFGQFSAYNFPSMIIICVFSYFYLEVLYMGLWRPNSENAQMAYISKEGRKAAKKIIQERYHELGKWTTHEITVLISFLILIMLYFSHNPGFGKGWGDVLFDPRIVKTVVPTIMIILCYFLIPIRYNFFNYCCKSKKETAPYHRTPTSLTWPVLTKNVSWGLIFLFGGGFALAEASKRTGLAVIIGDHLKFLNSCPREAVLFIVIFIAVVLSSFTANTAMVNIIIPIVDEISQNFRSHPLYLILPSGTACSMAYLFPVSTPPNAMVSDYSNMNTSDMVIAGLGPTFISLIIIFLMAMSWGLLIYPDLNTFPAWAEKTT